MVRLGTMRARATPRIDAELEPLIWHGDERLPMHPGQRQAWQSEARYVVVSKGWQAGGTVIGPPWLLREMQRRGPGDYAVVCPDYPHLENKALPELLRTFEGYVRTRGHELVVTPAGAQAIWGDHRKSGRILLRHAGYAEAIESFSAAAIWVDEAGMLDDALWTALKARGMVNRARFLLTSRPYRRNFFVKELWDAVMIERDGQYVRRHAADPEVQCINFSSLDNPRQDKESILAERDRLPEWRYIMLYLGIPTKAAGTIYDQFTPVAAPKIGERDQIASGHDFGTLNMAGVWAVRDHDLLVEGKPVWTVYAAYQGGNLSTSAHAKLFREKVPPGVEGKARTVWAWGGNKTSEQGWRDAFSAAGYPILEPTIGSVDKGIETTYGMLKSGQVRISSELTKLIRDLEDYAYEVDADGTPNQDKIEAKSTWHRLDALRYLCVGLASGAKLEEPIRNLRNYEKPVLFPVDEEGRDLEAPEKTLTIEEAVGDVVPAKTARPKAVANKW